MNPLIKKIRNYILRQTGITFYKESDSGSQYFKIDNYVIRLSNHITDLNPSNVMNIVVVGDQITLIVKNRPYPTTYKVLKERIRNYAVFADLFKPVIIKKPVNHDTLSIKIDDLKQIVIYNNIKYNFKSLAPDKWEKLKDNLENFPPKSEAGLFNVFNNFR